MVFFSPQRAQRAQRLNGFVVLVAVWSHAKTRSREGTTAGVGVWCFKGWFCPLTPGPSPPLGARGAGARRSARNKYNYKRKREHEHVYEHVYEHEQEHEG